MKRLRAVAHRRHLNTLRPRQNGRRFPDIFKCNFLNEDVWISIKISLKFVPKGPINNIPALVQIMAWRRLGDKPWSEPMMVSLLTHKCVTRPQWVITAGQINSLSLDAWPHCSEMCNVYGFHDLCVQRLANAWGSVTTNSIKSRNFVGIQFHIRIVYRFWKDIEWSTRTESIKRLYV